MTTPPDELPTYIEDTIENHADDPDVLAAISEYAAALHGETADAEDAPEPEEIRAEKGGTVEKIITGDDGWHYVVRKVKCGDESCKCASGADDAMHGPYVYKTKRDSSGEQQWEYVGKYIGGENVDAVDADAPAADA